LKTIRTPALKQVTIAPVSRAWTHSPAKIQAMSTQATAGPDPSLIFQTLSAFQQTEALKGAIELDIFTHIADGASSVAEIAQRAQAS
jgi:hypothetical protein